jgi:hypothetical protein
MMQKYRNVIFDIEQVTAERWNWAIYAKIGERERCWPESAEAPAKPSRQRIWRSMIG